MFRPIDYNALDREFRLGKPLSTEIRRRIVDLYLSREGPTVGVTYSGVYRIIRYYQSYGIYFPLSRGGRRILRKVVERWRVRWGKLTGFIDCKQGNKDQTPHNKSINTRLNRGCIRRYFLFPQVSSFPSLI